MAASMDLDTSEALAEANQSSSERSETVTVSVESFLEREVDVTTETGQEILVPYVPVHLNFQLKQLSRDLTPEERFAKLTQTLLTVRSCLTFLDSPLFCSLLQFILCSCGCSDSVQSKTPLLKTRTTYLAKGTRNLKKNKRSYRKKKPLFRGLK